MPRSSKLRAVDGERCVDRVRLHICVRQKRSDVAVKYFDGAVGSDKLISQ